MKLPMWRALLVLLVTGFAGWSAAGVARTPPSAGRFLVATRQQQGFFAKSVILLIAYGSDGALGIVVNHPTKFALAKVLPDPDVLHGRTDLLYVGGPVALDDLIILIRSPGAPPQSEHVVDGIYVSASMRTLRAVAGGKLAGTSFRAYAGYAGWAPGQLDAELQQGAWDVVAADADDVFTTAPAQLWNKLNRQGSELLVWKTPAATGLRSRCRGCVRRPVAQSAPVGLSAVD